MSDFDDFGGPINRPAQNARRATPGEAFGSQQDRAGDAGDFLGLNQDLWTSSPAQPPMAQPAMPQSFAQPEPAYVPQDYAQPQYAPQMYAQPEPEASAQSQYTPVAAQPELQQDDSWFLQTPEEPAPQSAVPAPEPEPVAATDASLLNTAWQEGARKRSSARWTAPLALAASVSVVALIALPRLRNDQEPGDPNAEGASVVTVMRVGEGGNEVNAPSPIEPIDAGESEPVTEPLRPPDDANVEPMLVAEPEPVEDSLATPREETPVATRSALEENGLVEVVDPSRAEGIVGDCSESENANETVEAETLAVAPTPEPVEPVASTFVGAPAPHGIAQAPAGPAVGPAAPADLDTAASDLGPTASSGNARSTKLEVDQVMLLDRGASALRAAKASDLQAVHSLATIPMESIGATSKLLTPVTGRVRAVLHSGEIFEGNLYAVGEGCLWLDTQYGRMGLDGSRVRSVVQIDVPPGTPALGSPGSQNSVGLDRVRIKTPGGIFYGKVIERTADKTTVICDDGARLTLASKDVELLTEAPTVRLGGN